MYIETTKNAYFHLRAAEGKSERERAKCTQVDLKIVRMCALSALDKLELKMHYFCGYFLRLTAMKWYQIRIYWFVASYASKYLLTTETEIQDLTK